MENDKSSRQNRKDEYKFMASFDHINIIKCYDAKFIKESSHSDQESSRLKFWIEMEYAEKGDLYSLIKTHKMNKEHILESQIMDYFVQICLGLYEIHHKGIVHRDIKSQNIFLNSQGKF